VEHVGHPLGLFGEGGHLCGCQGAVELGVHLLEGDLQAVLEAPGEGGPVDEEVWFGRVFEGAGPLVVGDAGDDDVDVGVVLELARPGVQDAGEAAPSSRGAELGLEHVLEGAGALFQEEVVEFFGVASAGGAEGFWDGEGDQEVGAALELAPDLQVGEEAEDLVGAEVWDMLTGVVAGDLARPVEVDLAGPFGEACELDIALELGIPWLRCDGGGLRRYFVGRIVFLRFIACEYAQAPSAHRS
jgi:hypothetical protein